MSIFLKTTTVSLFLLNAHHSYHLDAYIEEIVNLTWHVDPPSFPIGSNEEIKLNDMAITRTRYEKCAGPYPMFRGSGNCRSNCQKANAIAEDDTLSTLQLLETPQFFVHACCVTNLQLNMN
ncbi:hypothetical protein Y032_0194g1435 [Ancylostoma ceylanicum]|uniref:Uncharacterized protein n=1 Tax=Ancylostoma ceylanicum TaxID=53326 RepID=A0A016SQ25_9BILA|nr:hypothetical protein Y032_0194g1435 [Ancylostoma ceylanicum]